MLGRTECTPRGKNPRAAMAHVFVPDEAEAALVRAARNGDGRAFAELVRRHKGAVLRLAARFARTRGEVEDLGQETFFKAYRELDGFRGEASFGTWLRKVAVSCCLNALRRDRNTPSLGGDLDFEIVDESGPRALAAIEARETLDRLMERLDPKDRLIITLLELEGESVEQTAMLTGLSQVNVRVRAHRARARLRKLVEASHG